MSCLGLLMAAAFLWLIQGIFYKHLWKKAYQLLSVSIIPAPSKEHVQH